MQKNYHNITWKCLPKTIDGILPKYMPFSESIELIVVHKDESDYEEIELNDLWIKVNQAKT